MGRYDDTGMTFVRELDIRGQKIKVYVRADGRFASQHPHEVTSDTFEGLREALMKLTKKATTRLEIPVTVARHRGRYGYSAEHGQRLVDAVLRGKHGGNGNILIEYNDQRKKGTDQLSSYDYSEMFRPLNDAEKAEWEHLTGESLAADAALRTWVDEHKVDPHKLVDAALNKAAEEPDPRDAAEPHSVQDVAEGVGV